MRPIHMDRRDITEGRHTYSSYSFAEELPSKVSIYLTFLYSIQPQYSYSTRRQESLEANDTFIVIFIRFDWMLCRFQHKMNEWRGQLYSYMVDNPADVRSPSAGAGRLKNSSAQLKKKWQK